MTSRPEDAPRLDVVRIALSGLERLFCSDAERSAVELQWLIDAAENSRNDREAAAIWSHVGEISRELKGDAGLFGYGLVSELAAALNDLTSEEPIPDSAIIAKSARYVRALSALLAHGGRADYGSMSQDRLGARLN